MPELSDEKYRALGKFVYQFSNLERWVNWAIIEAEHIDDLTTRNQIPLKPLERRLNRLEAALNSCEKQGLHYRPEFNFQQAKDLGNRRDSLFHGEPWTLLKKVERADGVIEFNFRNVNYDPAFDQAIEVDEPTLQEMANEAHDLAYRLFFIVGNLSAAKVARGRPALTIGPAG